MMLSTCHAICVYTTLAGIAFSGLVVPARAETIRYRYDANNRLTQVKSLSNKEWTSQYDIADNRTFVGTSSPGFSCADRQVCNGTFAQEFTMWEGVENATLVSGRTGQAALVAQDAANSDIQQLLPGIFETGQTYRLTAWCKADVGNACRLFLGNSTDHIHQEWGGNGDWQEISTPPLTLTQNELLSVYLYSDTEESVTYDDVQIEETTPYSCADLAVCNGDFERGFEYWYSLNNSQLTTGQTGTGVHIDSDANNSDIIQTIPGTFPAGVTYRATAWCKASAGTTCQLFFGDSNVVNGPSYEHSGSDQLPADGTWQQLSVTITFTHPEQMEIYLYGGTETVYDDVEISQVSTESSVAKSLLMTKQDAAARTEPTPRPVPEPGTLLLLAGGLIGIFALLRRWHHRS